MFSAIRTRTIESLILLAAFTFAIPHQANAIANAQFANNFEAVVSLDDAECTGTFVHPHFIITAARCFEECVDDDDVGCRGRDGPVGSPFVGAEPALVAFGGPGRGEGEEYEIDHVYFARPSDAGRSRTPDVAIARTKSAFSGQALAVLAAQDLPKPPEDIHCLRWEYTWPTIVGFGQGNVTIDGIRVTTLGNRLRARAEVECDIERDETTFKLDGHGRSVPGGRACLGDFGGPALWTHGFFSFNVGGVISDADPGCSDEGETFVSFIPPAFLDRVATIDDRCGATASSWAECRGTVDPYHGYDLTYLGTQPNLREACSGYTEVGGRSVVSSFEDADRWAINPGDPHALLVTSSIFEWFCVDNTRERFIADMPQGTNFIVAKHSLTGEKVIFDGYAINARPSSSPLIPSLVSRGKAFVSIPKNLPISSGVQTFWETPSLQFNSGGGEIRATFNRANNTFRILVPDMGTVSGMAQLSTQHNKSAPNTSGLNYCKIVNWQPVHVDLEVQVRCFDHTGAPITTSSAVGSTDELVSFNLLFVKEDRSGDFNAAHLLADLPLQSHLPSNVRSWNSNDGTNSITRSGVGIYAAFLANVFHPDNGGTATVTAYGDGPERCHVGRWGNVNVRGTSVTVVCFAPDGSPADSQFVLSFSTDVAFGDSTSESQYGGYAQSIRGVVLPEFREYSNADFTTDFERVGTGAYRIKLRNPVAQTTGWDDTIVFVSAQSHDGSVYCGHGDTVLFPDGQSPQDIITLEVFCRDVNGEPANSGFTVTYLTGVDRLL